jgi:transcriptional regulator with XRE-family HTH domain
MHGHEASSYWTIRLTPRLCKAARAMLGWKQTDLAEFSQVGIATIRAYELGERDNARPATLKHLENAFERAGLEFHRGGVVLRELEAA